MIARSVQRVGLGLACALGVACMADEPTRHRSAPGALGPYSGSVSAGELLFLSGKIGERGGSFELEARTALDGVLGELDRAGAGPEDLLSVTVYLTDMGRYDAFNAIYADVLPAPYPARACVAVAALPAGARVEIQGVARRPARRGESP